MASLSSVGKSHYEVQQSFFLPSPLLCWALGSLGYAALLWTTRLFLSSKVEKILACSSEHLSKWKKEDSKQLGPFFESGKHKHLCMSDILICLSLVLFWRKQNIFLPSLQCSWVLILVQNSKQCVRGKIISAWRSKFQSKFFLVFFFRNPEF